MENLIIDIQRGSIHDGDGLRTTIFLKGCPLRCKWCHNPESQSFEKELSFIEEKCTLCGKCKCENGVHIFENSRHIVDYSKCIHCGKCVENCPNSAIEIVGKTICIDEIMKTVLKDKDFFDSTGGGVTISGGEPLANKDFTLEILKECKKEGIHCCIETSGHANTDNMLEIIKYCDIFYFDWKITEKSKEYIGVETKKMLKMLDFICKNGGKVYLRCPIIPSVNDNEKHFNKIKQLIDKYNNIIGAELLLYHNFGTTKAKHIGKEINEFPIELNKNKYLKYFNGYNVK